MSKPLILLDADTLGRQRTGDESYVANLLRELPTVADDLRFGAITRAPALLPEGVEPVHVPARSQVFRMAVSLPRVLRAIRPAVAHFQYAIPLGYARGAVLTVHDVSFEADRDLTTLRDRMVFQRAVRRSVRRASAVVTGSEFTRRQLIGHYELDRRLVVTVPYGVDPAFTAVAAPSRPRSKPYALFVGTLHPRKDPLTAVEAISLVEPRLDLVMVGPDRGSGVVIRQEAERLGISERVSLLGHVEQAELVELYGGASCLVFPSLYEGFGLPILEAMAAGTPVVAANTTSIPEVAGDAAILVDPQRPAALAGGIERALADRERLASLGRQQALRFSWRDSARKTAMIYRRVIESRAGTTA